MVCWRPWKKHKNFSLISALPIIPLPCFASPVSTTSLFARPTLLNSGHHAEGFYMNEQEMSKKWEK